MEQRYTQEFYNTTSTNIRSAREIVPIIMDLIAPGSVVDVGAGTGVWLKVFRDSGVDDVFGIDGQWVDRRSLQIPQELFMQTDLEQSFSLERRFDLALCLEVAEHISPLRAQEFVRSLTVLAPVVVFSAAIPFQGGTFHVNEQWPEYWVDLFEKSSFTVVDCIRNKIWDNPQVQYWYAQNMLIFVRTELLNDYPKLVSAVAAANGSVQLSMVHPKKYLSITDPKNLSVKKLLKMIVAYLKS